MAPQDQLTVYGCAFAEQKLGDIGPALKHLQAALEMEAPDALQRIDIMNAGPHDYD